MQACNSDHSENSSFNEYCHGRYFKVLFLHVYDILNLSVRQVRERDQLLQKHFSNLCIVCICLDYEILCLLVLLVVAIIV